MPSKTHFSRPVSVREIEKMLNSGIREFSMPDSCRVRMSIKALKKIEQRNGKITIENSAGRPIGLELEKILEVVELHNDHRTYRQISDITGIPKSTAHYLIKYAERNKIKKGGKTVYI